MASWTDLNDTMLARSAFACGIRSRILARSVSADIASPFPLASVVAVWRSVILSAGHCVELLAVQPLLEVRNLLRAVGLDDRQQAGA